MKIDPRDIAFALIETCASLPEGEHAAVADAALALLRKSGLGKEVRTFPRLVRDVLRKKEGIAFARLVMPRDDAQARAEVTSALEKGLKKNVQLTASVDVSLLGGAVLDVDDERFDASLRGVLDRLQTRLASSASSLS